MPDVPLHWVLALAWTSLALVLLMVLALVGLRLWRLRQAPRQARFEAHWLPLLLGCAAGDASAPTGSVLRGHERWALLLLWLRLQLMLQGPARTRLVDLGRALDLHTLARARLNSRHAAERMVALLALGLLGDADDAPGLLARLPAAGPQTVLYLARALLEIDPRTHAPAMARHLLARSDLDLTRTSVLLRPCAAPLGQALRVLWPEARSGGNASWLRGLRLALALRLQLPLAELQEALQPDQDPALILAALRLYQGEAGDAVVIAHAGHADWRVRVQVARALGQLGGPQAVPVLLTLVTDAQWWVRCRAAQALLRLPGQTPEAVRAHIGATGDRYAQSMAEAVLAEQQGPA